MTLSFPCRAQKHKPWSGTGIEFNAMAGKIYKHTKNFRAPVPERSTAFELNLVQQTYGRKAWQQRRNYPLVGVGLTYTDYGIDSIFGKCLSIYPSLELAILRSGPFSWTFRTGFGLAWVSRHYERNGSWDTLNNAIGSHFNNYTVFMTDLRYRVNEHLDLQLGGNFSHISNAALRVPNLGVNLYGVHIGLRYFPVTSRPEPIKQDLPRLKNRWLAQLRMGMAANEYGEADGPLYPVYLVSAFVSKRYAGKNKAFLGLDYSYHEGVYAFLRNNEIEPGRERGLSWKSSVFIGNEFLIGRFGVLLQVGYYLKDAYLQMDPYYQKLGCNIYLLQREKGLLKEAAVSVLLKTHKTQAELVELGLGFGF